MSGDAINEWVASAREHLVREQALLWNQLTVDILNAHQGGWSVGCGNTAGRIVENMRLVGPVGQGDITWEFTSSGLYNALCKRFEFEPYPMTSDETLAMWETMASHFDRDRHMRMKVHAARIDLLTIEPGE